MKYIFAFLLVCFSAHAQLQPGGSRITVPGLSIPVGETIEQVIIQFHVPMYEAVRPTLVNGRWARKLAQSDVSIVPVNQFGEIVVNARVNPFMAGDIIIMPEELDAAGEELSIAWVDATGTDEVRVIMRALLNKILVEFIEDATVRHATTEVIEAQVLAALAAQ